MITESWKTADSAVESTDWEVANAHHESRPVTLKAFLCYLGTPAEHGNMDGSARRVGPRKI